MSSINVRHEWMNYPTVTKQKCVRCGCLKDINKPMPYSLNGVDFKLSPKCIFLDKKIK